MSGIKAGMAEKQRRQSSACHSPTEHQGDGEPGPSVSGPSVRREPGVVKYPHAKLFLTRATSSHPLIHVEHRGVHTGFCRYAPGSATGRHHLRTRAQQQKKKPRPVIRRQEGQLHCLIISARPQGEFVFTTTCNRRLNSLKLLSNYQRLDTGAGSCSPTLLRWPGSGLNRRWPTRPCLPEDLSAGD